MIFGLAFIMVMIELVLQYFGLFGMLGANSVAVPAIYDGTMAVLASGFLTWVSN